jgi:hypothetical protein
MPETSLLYCAYKESVNLCNVNVNSWYKTVVFLSEKIGTTCNISLSRYKNLSLSVFKQYLKKFIRNNFLKYWSKRQQEGKSNGKLTTYFKIKDNFGIENYLFMKNFEHIKIICNLLITLRIESGRYEITKDKDGYNGKKIPLERSNRICQLCRGNCVEDETHFLIDCP